MLSFESCHIRSWCEIPFLNFAPVSKIPSSGCWKFSWYQIPQNRDDRHTHRLMDVQPQPSPAQRHTARSSRRNRWSNKTRGLFLITAVKGLRKHCWLQKASLASEANRWRLVEEKTRTGWNWVRGTVLTLDLRFSDGLQFTPSAPAITSPGRSAGAGGECTGQKSSLLPPRHSSTTLPKLEHVWATAPAGLVGCSPMLLSPGPLHIIQPFSGFVVAGEAFTGFFHVNSKDVLSF